MRRYSIQVFGKIIFITTDYNQFKKVGDLLLKSSWKNRLIMTSSPVEEDY